MDPKWLEWAKKLQAISQDGLVFTTNPFDIERYEKLREIAAEIMASNSDLDKAKMAEVFEAQEKYATPKVDVRGVVFRDDKILLVRERLDNKWTVPGGWADPCESASEAVEREVFEESGFKVKAYKLMAVYDRSKQGHTPAFPFHVYKMVFLCELLGGEATTSVETAEVGFFGRDGIPELSVARVLPGQIERMFEHKENPDLPTDFD